MKRTKFQRITALVLAVLCLFGSVMGVSAESNSVTDTTISDIKALLNAISYDKYMSTHAEVPRGKNEVVIDATDGYVYKDANGVVIVDSEAASDEAALPVGANYAYTDEFDGRKGLYIPGSGTVTWTIDKITEATKYNIAIDYYPVANKPADIERIFLINGETPFAEARYLTIPKVWKNVYPDGMFELPEGESADAYISKAEEIGIKATLEKTEKGDFIRYEMPECWTQDISQIVDEQLLRFFKKDIDKNEIRTALEQKPEWTEYFFKDSNGFYAEPFEFVLSPKEGSENIVELSLESVNEPIVISAIRLVPVEDRLSYKDYLELYKNEPEGKSKIKIEGEYFYSTSSQTIYPVEDRTNPTNSPSSTKYTLLNSVGGEKWQIAGQTIKYKFSVNESGMYKIDTRFRQNILDGMYTSRMLHLFSDDTLKAGDKGYYNGLPFAEASNIRFEYDGGWQSGTLNDGETEFKYYFEKDVVYTVSFEVSLGNMGSIVNRVQTSLNSINKDYLNVIKLTGASPDEYRDYGFTRVMPDTMVDFIIQSEELFAVANEIKEITGESSSMVATLEKVARLLQKMGLNEDEVAKNLTQLKDYIGTLGTWLGDAKTQPLQFDYIVIQGESGELPVAEAGFWKSFLHEISSFIMSFFRNYDRMGATEVPDEDVSVEVWLATGRDQSQVIRNLINNGFTSNTGRPVNLKLVSAGTLLPSILAGMGPDVYLGLAQSDVINYAIRGALIPIEDNENYAETVSDFNRAAMMVLEIEDANGEMHTYGLPETQSFPMMFIREDILADLEIDIPRTWDEVLEAIPVLQANSMEIGMLNDYKMHLYQMGGELYADGGMRINLDSNMALEAFDTNCSFYTMYSFPYSYNFANRFRTGEMPIGFADYCTTYNQLKVFATEIEGLWSFYPIPGYADEEGNINNVAVSAATAVVMVTNCSDIEGAWEYMRWHVGAECQTDYSNEMVALIGPSAKHPTANVTALESLPWTSEEYEQLALQFNNLAAIPNYPGSYIIDRYTNFAFLAAYNDGEDPVEQLQGYISLINKEITRKREEFELETLYLEGVDKEPATLAEKRLMQAIMALDEAKSSAAYNASYDAAYQIALDTIDEGKSDDFAAIEAAAASLRELNATLFAEAAGYMDKAVECLKSYEIYK